MTAFADPTLIPGDRPAALREIAAIDLQANTNMYSRSRKKGDTEVPPVRTTVPCDGPLSHRVGWSTPSRSSIRSFHGRDPLIADVWRTVDVTLVSYRIGFADPCPLMNDANAWRVTRTFPVGTGGIFPHYSPSLVRTR